MNTFFADKFSAAIWDTKYRGDTRDISSYFYRLANIISLGDKNKREKFYQLMINKHFSPGGRILAFGGRPNSKVSLMNCTTHKIEGDTLEDINNAAYVLMRASSRGQGIGINISNLRPRDSVVNNAAKTSTGAISFMEMLNHVGGTIGQEGRRAAILFSLDVSHPDIYRGDGYDFLNIKSIPGRVENANISVNITDDFMQKVVDHKDHEFIFSGMSGGEYFHVVRRMRARDLFNELARSAWRSAEPGVLFKDTAINMSNSNLFGDRWGIQGVNACSEIWLDQEGVCNLGSMNLFSYVIKPFTSDAEFNWVKFSHDVSTAIEFLDNVITVELDGGKYISNTQKESLENIRRIGLGIMGLADAFAGLGLRYGDLPSRVLLKQIMNHMRDSAYRTSIRLAKEKGRAKAWDTSQDYIESVVSGGFYSTLTEQLREDIINHQTRNITLLAIAPTGTISNLFGVSSGIEPFFARQYTRMTRMNGKEEYVEYSPPTIELAKRMGADIEHLFPTAYEVTPSEHINMQELAQRYVDSSISKTINFHSSSTPEDIATVYMDAWKRGIKGLSVYRDGSRQQQVLYNTETKEEMCPDCGGELVIIDGCSQCKDCGIGMCKI